MRRFVVLLVAEALLLVVSVGLASAQEIGAKAEVKDSKNKTVANATFAEDQGKVNVDVQAKDLEPGEYGIHIHEKGDCGSFEEKSAGEHFNPEDKEHGVDNPKGSHAGDLPDNVKVDEDGTGSYQATTDKVTLSEGETSLFDSDGSALQIHTKADDQKTDPGGDAGEPGACGEIEKTSQKLPTSGGPPIVSIAAILGIACVGAVALLWRRAARSS